jgi:hypothetical protein
VRVERSGLRARPSSLIVLGAAFVCGIFLSSCDECEPARDAASADPEARWHSDYNAARDEARRLNKPMLVVSVVGDMMKHC